MNRDNEITPADEQVTAAEYQTPAVTDHGSLTELTLHAGSTSTDGMGPGGGS